MKRSSARKIEKLLGVSCVYAVVGVMLLLGSIRAVSEDPGAVYVRDTSSGLSIRSEENGITTEEFWGDGKRHVRVKNQTSDEVYVRATPVYTVTDPQGRLVDAIISDGEYLEINTNGWFRIGGSYYYRYPLGAGKYTSFLITDALSVDKNGNYVKTDFILSSADRSSVLAGSCGWEVVLEAGGSIKEKEK